jgi:uncharacterized protein YndB with AHSA1/START domain
MIDVERYFGAVTREVAAREVEGKLARVVVAERDYDTDIEDLWDALTNRERIPRWCMPIEGELRVGGKYQLIGNAHGTILECERPTRLKLTWTMAEEPGSWVTVTLAPAGRGTRLLLEHAAPVDGPGADEFWNQYGPGAVGVGWDLLLVGLALHLATRAQVDAKGFEDWTLSDEGKGFVTRVSEDWGRASIASGADPDWAKAAAARTTAFYTGAPPPEG